MIEGGTFDELPKLCVVVTTLAIGGVLLAGGFGDGERIRRDAPALARRHIYIDTMGIHPAVIAARSTCWVPIMSLSAPIGRS